MWQKCFRKKLILIEIFEKITKNPMNTYVLQCVENSKTEIKTLLLHCIKNKYF